MKKTLKYVVATAAYSAYIFMFIYASPIWTASANIQSINPLGSDSDVVIEQPTVCLPDSCVEPVKETKYRFPFETQQKDFVGTIYKNDTRQVADVVKGKKYNKIILGGVTATYLLLILLFVLQDKSSKVKKSKITIV